MPRYDSAWTGEYCICTGLDKFAGFGLRLENVIEFSSKEIREELLGKAIGIYKLMEEKAPPIWEAMSQYKITEPIIDNVIINNPCYRVNTSAIIQKLNK